MQTLRTLLELFPGSIAAGVLIAALCSALGVVVILKRMVFIGAALSEGAACGIALAMVTGLPPFVGAGALTLAFGLGLSRPYESSRIPRDAVLGVLFVGAGAASLLIAARAGLGLEEIKTLLYGDLILTRPGDLLLIALVALPLAVAGWRFRHAILYSFLDREAALLLGVKVRRCELLFFAALALAVAVAARAAGAMLVFAYLVVAPSAALLLSQCMGRVVALACGLSAACTLAGLYLALALDLPANQLIVALLVAALAGAAIRSGIMGRMRRGEQATAR